MLNRYLKDNPTRSVAHRNRAKAAISLKPIAVFDSSVPAVVPLERQQPQTGAPLHAGPRASCDRSGRKRTSAQELGAI
jgi:hypothetical protein